MVRRCDKNIPQGLKPASLLGFFGTTEVVPFQKRICATSSREREIVNQEPNRCLVLACGNALRSDDGVGPKLAEWAAERFQQDANVRVVARQQWTPELAKDIADADSVLFVDSSTNSVPGRVSLAAVPSNRGNGTPETHHLEAHELLGLTRSLYGSMSAHAMLLTVGASSTELGETLSEPVEAALPRARGVLEKAVQRFIEN
jgi:hydrogenase maturation protease